MEDKNISNSGQNLINMLDDLKKTSIRGIDYWWARDLQNLLGYSQWRDFENVIKKAKMSCASVGGEPSHNFADKRKSVTSQDKSERFVNDIALTRYACYLVAMNGEPSKPEIAAAQTYFAVKTHQQELSEQDDAAESRLALRDKVKDAVKYLNSAAKEAGVEQYGLFHDAGYRGLYGEIGLPEIKKKKGIDPKEDLFDRIDRAELAANAFRITQTELTLRNQQIKGEQNARETHHRVGQEVRNTIKKIGGKMPEQLPAAPSIKQLKKEQKKKPKELPPPSIES
jgi:DNA-damage-inducible protein D